MGLGERRIDLQAPGAARRASATGSAMGLMTVTALVTVKDVCSAMPNGRAW